MAGARDQRGKERIAEVGYRAPDDVGLDVEVVDAVELGRRVEEVPDRGIERVDLLGVLYVQGGRYDHAVDFETHRCTAGSALVVRPGQVHRFGATSGWQGWLVVARPEHDWVERPPSAPTGQGPDDLRTHVRLDPPARRAVEATLRQMAADAAGAGPSELRNRLLVHQLRTVLVRLELADGRRPEATGIDPRLLDRFRQFRAELDREHARWRSVAPYARALGCSERSLSRACETVAGRTAKGVITDRVVLEAKRLLVHTDDPVAVLASRLGFDEATNFVKFFRRETGTTPGAFRATGHA